MRIWTKEKVAEQYVASCAIIQQATETGEYRKSNRERAKLISAYKWLEKHPEEAEEVLGALLCHDSPVVQTKAAAHCLGLAIRTADALDVLERVSGRNDIWGFNAEMVLKVYAKNGQLKVY
ncbi:MAG: HEAT repeat domain-containing protein [Clostridia bacterium]|nr:HEAT repeat domain-containing protein [Clostridia bacterium]